MVGDDGKFGTRVYFVSLQFIQSVGYLVHVVRLLPCNGAELTKLHLLCLMKWSRTILPVMPVLWSNM